MKKISLQDMTGFGKSEVVSPYGRFSIALTSYNHRFCDISVNLPQNLLAFEPVIRKYVAGRVRRGKINVSFNWLEICSKQKVKIDEELARSFLNAIRQTKKRLGLSGDVDLSLLFSFPQLVRVGEKKGSTEKLFSHFRKGLEEAVKALLVMRGRGGRSLYRALHKILPVIKKEISFIKKRSKFVVEDYQQKLLRRIKKLRAENGVDKNRLATEVAVFAARVNVTEELVRLENFLKDFEIQMGSGEFVGKKLDFILQEMLREANTLGSKMRESAVLRSVVNIKAGLEEIRELVQNVA